MRILNKSAKALRLGFFHTDDTMHAMPVLGGDLKLGANARTEWAPNRTETAPQFLVRVYLDNPPEIKVRNPVGGLPDDINESLFLCDKKPVWIKSWITINHDNDNWSIQFDPAGPTPPKGLGWATKK